MSSEFTSDSQKIYIASDHAGLELKDYLIKSLPRWSWVDLGPQKSDGSVDYPDYAEKLGLKIAHTHAAQGVLICGSGVGVCIAANKIPGVRAAQVENLEVARLSREHNDANVICIGARFLKPATAAALVKVWLETSFSGEERHAGRVEKIRTLEKRYSS